MDKIFNFAIQDLDYDFSSPSFDQLRKGNLLRIYIKELVSPANLIELDRISIMFFQ